MEEYVLSMLVDNQEGVLSRIASLFCRRGYHISNLSFGKTEDSEFFRMTIVFSSDSQFLSQIMSQIKKLVNVRQIEELRAA